MSVLNEDKPYTQQVSIYKDNGQTTIPKAVLDKLDLEKGDRVYIVYEDGVCKVYPEKKLRGE